MNIVKHTGLFLMGLLFLACAGSPVPAENKPADELDAAIRETSDYLNKQLPKGNKLVVLNIQSEYPALSEYIIDELIANTVNDKIFSVVDRQQLNTIRAELDFQMSGEVDDDTAQALGRMAGAQIIISGAVSRIGDLYRLRVRALSVQTAAIEGQFNRNIPEGATVAALVQSRATGYGSGMETVATRTQPDAAQTPAPAGQATPTLAAPAPAKEYKIGDTGPAGGIIFYDKGMREAGWRYLEVMPNDFNDVQWGLSGEYSFTGFGTQTAIGDGRKNTELLVAAHQNKKETGRAAQLAVAFDGGGYTDWFLPSKDELNLMYKNLKQNGNGGFSNGWYWSSSALGGGSASYSQRFSDGTQGSSQSRDTPCSVRFVRAF
jgi:hypothetical protein